MRLPTSCGMLLWPSALTLALVLTGCSTRGRVKAEKAQGHKEPFAAAFEPTWNAAVRAVYDNRLILLTTNLNREGGFIAAERGLHYVSVGENIGFWVTPSSPVSTDVQVVTRQKGALLWPEYWGQRVLQSLSTNLGQQPVAPVLPAVAHQSKCSVSAPVALSTNAVPSKTGATRAAKVGAPPEEEARHGTEDGFGTPSASG